MYQVGAGLPSMPGQTPHVFSWGQGGSGGGEKEDSLSSPECPLEDGGPATWLPRKAKVEKDYQVCDRAS